MYYNVIIAIFTWNPDLYNEKYLNVWFKRHKRLATHVKETDLFQIPNLPLPHQKKKNVKIRHCRYPIYRQRTPITNS